MTARVDAKGCTGWSRRHALQVGSLLAASGALALPRVMAAQGTPVAAGDNVLLMLQSFNHGSLFPTQGDDGVPSYTLILWDAAERGLFYTAAREGVAGFAPTESLLIALAAGERPHAAVVVPASGAAGGQQVWAMQLVYGSLGSDPGAVTYQGEAIDEAEAVAWLGATPTALPQGPEELAGGYLLIAGLPALDLPEAERVRIDLG